MKKKSEIKITSVEKEHNDFCSNYMGVCPEGNCKACKAVFESGYNIGVKSIKGVKNG